MNKIEKIYYLIILAIILFTVLAFIFGIPGARYAPEYREFGGVIRINQQGNWYVFNNKTHTSINLGKVDTTEKDITVWYVEPIGVINYASITSHGSVVRQGILCGASVDTKYVRISCSKNGEIVDMRKAWDQSYIWIFVKGEI